MEKKEGKLLIVDDNLMNIELLEATLEPLGYEILSYLNPLKALEELKQTKIELAMIDIVMPEMDGFEFTEKFIKNHKNTPIIYVSAHGANENKIRGYNLGSFAYIEKPFDVNTTRAQVKSVLKLKKMQDELLKEKKKLDIIYQFTKDEIILTDVDFNIISQNHKLLKEKKHLNKNFLEILKENDQIENIENLLNFTKSNEENYSFRLILEKSKYTKTNISKIHEDGQDGYLIVITDLTEEIKAEKERERFVEMLTHDLKTPVRAEKRALELLLDGSFGELNLEQSEMIKEILNSSKYMMRMTDNVLTRYKIDNGQCKINKKLNSIKQTLQNCIDGLKYLIDGQNQTIKVYTEVESDVFYFDEIEIKRVITNIIANASEYSPEGTTIFVSLKENKENIELTIEDQGLGIPEDKLDKIFDEYISGAERFKKVGSGLGLFISKKIIEAHNGKIYVTSKENKGSKFTISLPIEQNCNLQLAKN